MTVEKILEWLDSQNCHYVFTGRKEQEITGFSSLVNYRAGTITWIKNNDKCLIDRIPGQLACAVAQDDMKGKLDNVIYTNDSKNVFFSVLSHFWGMRNEESLKGEGTVLSENVIVAPTVSIGCNCSIVGEIQIGAHTVIEHNVIIQGRVKIGENCHIQSGVIIGIDGYGYNQNSDTKKKKMVEHFGGVTIGNDVFIGSHVNIARGTLDDTVIGDGVKIAPSTHIGHNNLIDENAAIICSNLYGSVQIGSGSYITASTVENQTIIGKNSVIGMGSVVRTSVRDNVIAYGIPAKVIRANDSGL